jgi:hypothetical protein
VDLLVSDGDEGRDFPQCLPGDPAVLLHQHHVVAQVGRKEAILLGAAKQDDGLLVVGCV